jgi:hypothetical protein
MIFIGSNISIPDIDAATTFNPNPPTNTLVINQANDEQEQAELIGKGTLFLSTAEIADFFGDINDDNNDRILIEIDAGVGQADPNLIIIEEDDTDIKHQPIFIYPGSYTIKVKEDIDRNDNDNFLNDISDEVSFSGDCPVGTIGQIGDENNCIIIFDNATSRDDDDEEIGDVQGELIEDASIEEVGEVQAETGVQGASITKGTFPVDVCITSAEVVEESGRADLGDVVIPISATYNFQGKVSFDKLKSILKDSRNNDVDPGLRHTDYRQLIFDILFDNNRADNTKVSLVNSPFFSSIYSSLPPFNHETAGFELTKIWTNCKFTSIAKLPTMYEARHKDESSRNNLDSYSNILPLGVPEDKTYPKEAILQDKVNEIAFQTRANGLKTDLVNTAGTELKPLINPPFILCTNKFAQASIDLDDASQSILVDKVNNVLSKYSIVTGISESDLSAITHKSGVHTVSIQITIDTIDDDLAKVTNTNNDAVKINMVIDPFTKDAKVINLATMEISTECLDVNYSSELSQNPF